MTSIELSLLALVSLSLYSPVHGTPQSFHARNYVTPDQRSPSYDYVIAGGGLAGLVLASRLSQDSSNTVLVLEAGPSGDDVRTQIDVPSQTYFNSLIAGDPYNWMYTTVPQANAGGRNIPQPRGRVLGGSSAVNGMYLIRPSKTEIDAWSSLIAPNDQTAADTWNWDSFFTAFKKTGNFTGPVVDAESVAAMKYTTSSHGTGGRLQVSYPGYMVPLSGTWLPTLQAAGVSVSEDSYSGTNIGGMFVTSTINPANWTRSYSKSAYIDDLPPLDNLHIISGATVERIIFSDTLVNNNSDRLATGVQFSTGQDSAVQNVTANKEVVLCAGAMGSPHLLLLSGVGPKDVLDAAGVPVRNELPGVGQQFVDHLSGSIFYATSAETQGSIHASGSAFSQSAEFNSFINSGVAYINGSLLFSGGDSFNTFRSSITSAAASSAASLVPSQYGPVIEGYKAGYQATSQSIYPSTALVEILLSLNIENQVIVQAALQQPLSRGRLYINSSSIYDKPVIDPQYFSHPADITVLRQGIKLVRQIGGTSPLKDSLGDEITPGPSVQTDADIEAWLRNTATTQYHPSSTCSMLPRSQGGVVDARLKVYGLANVRVVDSSVFPISFSAHLMAPTYALAETAASLILSGTSSTTSTSSSSTVSQPSSTGSTAENKSGSMKPCSCCGLLALIGALLLYFFQGL